MDKAIADKVRECKALQGKTVVDVIEMAEFKDNLAIYWAQQRESRKQVEKNYKMIAKQVPAHPIAQIMNFSVDDMAFNYIQILMGKSLLPSSTRKYITQLCQQAYHLTIAQIICKEFPELEPELLPKAKAN